MRCMSLAGALSQKGWLCRFACSQETFKTIEALEKSAYEVVSPDNYQDQTALLVVDHYELDKTFEASCRSWARKIMVLDDMANRPHDCDILIDQTVGRKAEDYESLVPSHCDILTGAHYALLRPQFSKLRPKALQRRQKNQGNIERVMVSMGSTNIYNITGTVLAALNGWDDKALKIDVVLGSGAYALKDIRAYIEKMNEDSIHNVTLHINIEDMAALMAQADLAFGSGGTTSWERCCVGLPAIMIEIADNQALIANKLHNEGAVFNLGWYKQLTTDIIRDTLSRLVSRSHIVMKMSETASKICDGSGTEKVYNVIKKHINGIDTNTCMQ